MLDMRIEEGFCWFCLRALVLVCFFWIQDPRARGDEAHPCKSHVLLECGVYDLGISSIFKPSPQLVTGYFLSHERQLFSLLGRKDGWKEGGTTFDNMPAT